jgi:hypothetical protein
MFLLLLLLLCLLAVSVMWLPVVIRRRAISRLYSGSRLVACPENQQAAAVNMDARHAMATAIDGSPHLRLSACTRWPERANCNQACLADAARVEPYAPGERKSPTKQIYHLPIVLAAFVAWCLGVIWHSQWMFRARWMAALAVTHAQLKQMVWRLTPHVLTAAVCLLFAYGVAWLLAVSHRKGLFQGVLMSMFLCAALLATNWYGFARLPHDLLMIEAGYAVLAALAMGAIIGGFTRKLAPPSFV